MIEIRVRQVISRPINNKKENFEVYYRLSSSFLRLYRPNPQEIIRAELANPRISKLFRLLLASAIARYKELCF